MEFKFDSHHWVMFVFDDRTLLYSQKPRQTKQRKPWVAKRIFLQSLSQETSNKQMESAAMYNAHDFISGRHWGDPVLLLWAHLQPPRGRTSQDGSGLRHQPQVLHGLHPGQPSPRKNHLKIRTQKLLANSHVITTIIWLTCNTTNFGRWKTVHPNARNKIICFHRN